MSEVFLTLSYVLLGLSAFGCLVRAWRGPTIFDRVIAIDTIALVVVATLLIHPDLHVDAALGLALFAFVSTVLIGHFLGRGSSRMSDGWFELLGSLLTLAGAFFFLSAVIGLLRLPDFYTRAHAPTKAATLGLMLAALGSIALHAESGAAFMLEELLLTLFVLLTVPVSTQMLVRGAAARGIQQARATQGEPTAGPIERLEDAAE